jgi:RHS repeat-associated protein
VNPQPSDPVREYAYRAGEMLIQADASDCKWLVSDHLGSPRIILGKSGSLADTRRRDFMPFGEDLGAGQFGRTTAQGYEPSGTPSNPREKFATYERDDETGLDFDQARYYQSKLGRFTTPDEFTGGPAELFVFDGRVGDNPTFYADLDAPQSLNKYQYCLNNPLRYVDPYGHQQTATADAAADAAAVARQARMANAEVRAGAVARSVHPVAGLVILAAELLFGTPEGRALLHEAMTAPARLNLSGSRDEFGVRGPNLQNIMQAQAQDAAQPPPGASGQQSGQASGGAMPPDDKKGGSEGRDARKINQKRLDAAKQNVASLRKQFDILDAKPNKTPQDHEELNKLRRALTKRD